MHTNLRAVRKQRVTRDGATRQARGCRHRPRTACTDAVTCPLGGLPVDACGAAGGGCRDPNPENVCDALANRPFVLENLSFAKQRVREYQSRAYDADLSAITTRALEHFKRLRCRGALPPRAVVVFDLDDTLWSSFSQRAQYDFGSCPGVPPVSNYPPIRQTVQLYYALLALGIATVLLSGRESTSLPQTLQNLRNAGIDGYSQLLERSTAEDALTAEQYKAARRAQLEREGAVVIGSVGDQLSDLSGGHAGYLVKVPNFLYFIE